MPQSPSLSPLSIASEAWAFFRRQPALLHVLIWLIIAPSAALEAMDEYWPQSDAPAVQDIGHMGYGLAVIVMMFLLLWGTASTLLVSRRILQSRAGRSRTSFASVRRESVSLIVPLLFTSILRGIITAYWALPYLAASLAFVLTSSSCQRSLRDAIIFGTVPPEAAAAFFRGCSPLLPLLPLLLLPIVYSLRTFFWDAVVAGEKLKYRDALRRSRDVVKGRGWRTMGVVIVLGFIIYVPAQIPVAIARYAESLPGARFSLADELTGSIMNGLAGMLFTLSSVELFRRLRARMAGAHEVVPEEI